MTGRDNRNPEPTAPSVGKATDASAGYAYPVLSATASSPEHSKLLIRALGELLVQLKKQPWQNFDGPWLARFCRQQNAGVSDVALHVKKRALLPAYWKLKETHPEVLDRWRVGPALEDRLVQVLRAKPRRTASGVATITVISKPWPCSGTCRFCPSDLRMPKSYVANEPACQRAEQCLFDPFLQVSGRLNVLAQMGHPTDKVELIVLGGTWTEYPPAYQRWFAHELFRALNAGVGAKARELAEARRHELAALGLTGDTEARAAWVAPLQREVDRGALTYNAAWKELYGAGSLWEAAGNTQVASAEELAAQQMANETAACRCVGLSFETRPDAVTVERLQLLRELGCTKVQIGVQSTFEELGSPSLRSVPTATMARAFALLRLFGFKIHAHLMANLPGATPQTDRADYKRLVADPRFEPDEVKLYPCALIAGTPLEKDYAAGLWKPYERDVLTHLMVDDILATPPFVRVSRMIRDFSSTDIVAGNKQANLRQAVEQKLAELGRPVHEIRFREVALGDGLELLRLHTYQYVTSCSRERFLEFRAADGTIHGFLRLSLPDAAAKAANPGVPGGAGDAMIREVHVYGRVAQLGQAGTFAQHRGLGRTLIQKAAAQAAHEGYTSLLVISAIGTRAYYQSLGFEQDGLYQRLALA